MLYLDDGIMVNSNKLELSSQSEQVQNGLFSAGFAVNVEKSQWEPVQRMTWLGLLIDQASYNFFVPNYKFNSFNDNLYYYLTSVCVTPRNLAKII